MIMTNKLLPVALIAALVGGSVGALVMSWKNQPTASAENAALDSTRSQTAGDEAIPAEFNTSDEQTAYKVGFAEGFRAAEGTSNGTSSLAPAAVGTQRAPVVSRNAGRRNNAHSTSSRSTNYSTSRSTNYSQPRSRSFWDKHRDKLTVAIGAGSGAAVGGLVGGKKGAGIGALAGGGGSALYTYKLRNRNNRR